MEIDGEVARSYTDEEIEAIRLAARAPLILLLREALDEIGALHFFPSGMERQSKMRTRIVEAILSDEGR